MLAAVVIATIILRQKSSSRTKQITGTSINRERERVKLIGLNAAELYAVGKTPEQLRNDAAFVDMVANLEKLKGTQIWSKPDEVKLQKLKTLASQRPPQFRLFREAEERMPS
jgi:hypothetical protein